MSSGKAHTIELAEPDEEIFLEEIEEKRDVLYDASLALVNARIEGTKPEDLLRLMGRD